MQIYCLSGQKSKMSLMGLNSTCRQDEKETLPFATTWVDLEGTVLSDSNNKYCLKSSTRVV